MQKAFLLFLSICLLVSSCKEPTKDYDRGPMLENVGNNVIIPAYKNAHETALVLKNAMTDFNAFPTNAKLQVLKAAFIQAYVAWQAVETYDFAKGEGQNISLNTFPTDTAKIRANVMSGNYNLEAASNTAAKGFPALDYMLFSGSENEVINLAIDFPYVRPYLQAVTDDISAKATAIYDDWNTTYIQTFIKATALDVSGSTGLICNAWAQNLERNRRERVGNALGYIGFIASGNIQPKTLEGYYSRTSKELLLANLQANKQLFTGNAGVGFDDYPQVKSATFQGVALNEEITNQFDKCIAATQAITTDFETALTSEKSKMETLFLELKKLTVLIKVDLSSAIGVTINYTDNDGD